jgi:hypothetical protein
LSILISSFEKIRPKYQLWSNICSSQEGSYLTFNHLLTLTRWHHYTNIDTLTLITIRENYLIGCNCPYVLNICSSQEGPCHSITPMLIWKWFCYLGHKFNIKFRHWCISSMWLITFSGGLMNITMFRDSLTMIFNCMILNVIRWMIDE